MMHFLKNHKYLAVLLMLVLAAGLVFTGCGADDISTTTVVANDEFAIVEDGHYTAPQDVADYL